MSIFREHASSSATGFCNGSFSDCNFILLQYLTFGRFEKFLITKCITVISLSVFLPCRDMYSHLVQVSFFVLNVRITVFTFHYHAL